MRTFSSRPSPSPSHTHFTNNALGQQQQKYKKKLLELQQNTKTLIRRRPSHCVTLAQANYCLNLFHTILCAVGHPDMRASKYNTDASFILPNTIGPSLKNLKTIKGPYPGPRSWSQPSDPGHSSNTFHRDSL